MHRYYTCFLILALLFLTKNWCEAKGSLVTLDEDSWTEMLTGEWMVDFYAPWCPACKALDSEWKSFASWSDDLGVKIGAVDVTANPGLSGRFMVTALPTIYHVKDGVFRQYKGARDSNSFVSFIEEKKWKSIEPVSDWKSPNSVLMSVVSYFFKISMALRSIHTRLVEDYGIPYWGSYILFAFATILLGAVLGLMIVCVIDLLFPAKPTPDKKQEDRVGGDVKDNTDLLDEDSKAETTETRELRRRKRVAEADEKTDESEKENVK